MMAWWLLATVGIASADSTTICFEDAITHAPIVAVQLTATARPSGASTSRSSAEPIGSCMSVPPGTWHARRIGYREQSLTVSIVEARRTVLLQPLSATTVALDTVQVRGEPSRRAPSPTARMTATLHTANAQARGAATVAQLLEQLPLTTVTSARGETGLSLRGARREQTVITLDGVSLNDPSTGVADVSDLPLAAVGSATVALGADPVSTGPGASGGVLALTTAVARQLQLRVGALGSSSLDAAWSTNLAGALWHGAITRRVAANDFRFVNDAGASPTTETRVNNDESRVSLLAGAIASRWQFAALISHSDRGMVGPANVRTYDADRARTDRLSLRAQSAWRDVEIVAGVRRFDLAYRDPTRPPLDANATAQVADLDLRGHMAPFAVPLTWRVGGGRDALEATGGVQQARDRAYAVVDGAWQFRSVHAEVGARLDAFSASPLVPSMSAALEQPLNDHIAVGARFAQAVRMPTLYDLYFSSPQRLTVRALEPERVVADGELSVRMQRVTPIGRANAQLSFVHRETRDAIVWFPGNFGWSPANVGRERLHGVEGRAELQAPHSELSAWFSLYDAALRTDALTIPTPYTPRVAVGAQSVSSWRHSALTLRSRFADRRPFTAGPRNPAFELPAVTLVDAALTHPLPTCCLPRRWTASITWSLENATNVAWQSVRGFPSPGRTWAISFTLHDTPSQ